MADQWFPPVPQTPPPPAGPVPAAPASRDAARRQLMLPAVTILVLNGITFATMALNLALRLLDGRSGAEIWRESFEPLRDLGLFRNMTPQEFERMIEAMGQFDLLVGGLGALVGLVSIVGAVAMLRVRGLALAMAGAIACLLPCCGPNSCCCFLAIPIGIWAIVVLQRDEVQRAFELP